VPALLACVFTHAGATRAAEITDLSLHGAFLTSKFLPPKGSAVTISLETPQSKKPLTVTGTVVRGSWGMSEEGDVSRFGVLFDSVPPGLLGLLRVLISKEEDRTASGAAPGKQHTP